LILVTGGAGNMGRRLALAGQGRSVRILCLPGDAAAAVMAGPANGGGRIETVSGDITLPHTLPAACAGVATLFHLAALVLSPGEAERFHAVNGEGTRNLVAAAEAAGCGHFIYVSSISVEYPRLNAYARSKAEGEKWVKRSRLAYTIIRPTLAYTEGGAQEFMGLVAHLRRGPLVCLPTGGRARKSPVHIDDLVAGFLALPDNPKAHGKTYAFSGGEILTLREMAEALLAHMGRPKPILPVPAWICLLGLAGLGLWAKLSGRRSAFTYQTYTGLIQDAAPSHRAAEEDLGYRPRPFREAVAHLRSLRGVLAQGRP
jgi:nucleoside-diphosphate-sugar epimerase